MMECTYSEFTLAWNDAAYVAVAGCGDADDAVEEGVEGGPRGGTLVISA
jgi:hypothetical protein